MARQFRFYVGSGGCNSLQHETHKVLIKNDYCTFKALPHLEANETICKIGDNGYAVIVLERPPEGDLLLQTISFVKQNNYFSFQLFNFRPDVHLFTGNLGYAFDPV